jgi:hypothetical protein
MRLLRVDSMRLRVLASTNDVTFAVRLAREFAASKGRNRLLSLGLFADAPSLDGDMEADALPPDEDSSSLSNTSGLADAYEFMRRRRATSEGGQDPTLARWYARLRLSNYTAADTAPLCVGSPYLLLEIIAIDLSHVHRLRASVRCWTTSCASVHSGSFKTRALVGLTSVLSSPWLCESPPFNKAC